MFKHLKLVLLLAVIQLKDFVDKERLNEMLDILRQLKGDLRPHHRAPSSHVL